MKLALSHFSLFSKANINTVVMRESTTNPPSSSVETLHLRLKRSAVEIVPSHKLVYSHCTYTSILVVLALILFFVSSFQIQDRIFFQYKYKVVYLCASIKSFYNHVVKRINFLLVFVNNTTLFQI